MQAQTKASRATTRAVCTPRRAANVRGAGWLSRPFGRVAASTFRSSWSDSGSQDLTVPRWGNLSHGVRVGRHRTNSSLNQNRCCSRLLTTLVRRCHNVFRLVRCWPWRPDTNTGPAEVDQPPAGAAAGAERHARLAAEVHLSGDVHGLVLQGDGVGIARQAVEVGHRTT